MRTDPTDTGGLFVGRRPGTRPVRYRTPPAPGSVRRQRMDRAIAVGIVVAMVLVNLTYWGPLPAAWLWIASQIQWRTNNVGLAILVAFLGLIATLMAILVILRRLDQAWILVRRAAGYDQRSGIISLVFATTCVIGTSAFMFWLIILHGPAPSFSPGG